MFFNENIVCLYYGDFEIFNLVHFRYTTDHQISMLFNENGRNYYQLQKKSDFTM